MLILKTRLWCLLNKRRFNLERIRASKLDSLYIYSNNYPTHKIAWAAESIYQVTHNLPNQFEVVLLVNQTQTYFKIVIIIRR